MIGDQTEAEKAYTERQEELRKAYCSVFQGHQANHVLRNMLLRYGFWDPIYVPGDALTTAYQEGRRAVMLDILRIIDVDPDTIRAAQNQAWADQTAGE